MPDENEVLTNDAQSVENETDTNVEQAEQPEESGTEVPEGETEDNQKDDGEQSEAKPTDTDYKKQYEELQKLQGRQGTELSQARRELEQVRRDLERFKPKEQAPDPFEKDPYLKGLPDNQKNFLKQGVKAVLESMGVNLGDIPKLNQRVEQQEVTFRQRELADERNNLIKEVGEDAFAKNRDKIADKYDQLAQAMGINYWPPIPLQDVWHMVTASDMKKGLAERAKANREQRAQRVAAADSGKTSPKFKEPSDLDSDALGKMSDRDAFYALFKREKSRAG